MWGFCDVVFFFFLFLGFFFFFTNKSKTAPPEWGKWIGLHAVDIIRVGDEWTYYYARHSLSSCLRLCLSSWLSTWPPDYLPTYRPPFVHIKGPQTGKGAILVLSKRLLLLHFSYPPCLLSLLLVLLLAFIPFGTPSFFLLSHRVLKNCCHQVCTSL